MPRALRSAGPCSPRTAARPSGSRTAARVSRARICRTSSNASTGGRKHATDPPVGGGSVSPARSRSSRRTTAASRPRASRARGRRLPPGCRWPPDLALQANDRGNLDRHAERELAGAERLAGVAAALPEHFEDQVGGAVEHLGLLFEAG